MRLTPPSLKFYLNYVCYFWIAWFFLIFFLAFLLLQHKRTVAYRFLNAASVSGLVMSNDCCWYCTLHPCFTCDWTLPLMRTRSAIYLFCRSKAKHTMSKKLRPAVLSFRWKTLSISYKNCFDKYQFSAALKRFCFDTKNQCICNVKRTY